MTVLSGTLAASSLTDVLRTVVSSKKTGYLKFKMGGRDGFIAVEKGIILNAIAGAYSALPALFQFVSWREGTFDFQEQPIRVDVARDLAVYDPEVLIAGIAFKVDEQTLLYQAIPPLDSVLCYTNGKAITSVESTPADLSLLMLADGQRTVREIAETAKMNPQEVARNLARFRLAGVLDLVTPKSAPTKRALASTG